MEEDAYLDFLPKETDVHLIQENEDGLHVGAPTCPCKPRFIGLTENFHRLFEHRELVVLH